MTIVIDQDIKANRQPDPKETLQKKIGIPKEILVGECRVAITPDTAKILRKYGFQVLVETGAGTAVNFCDDV